MVAEFSHEEVLQNVHLAGRLPKLVVCIPLIVVNTRLRRLENESSLALILAEEIGSDLQYSNFKSLLLSLNLEDARGVLTSQQIERLLKSVECFPYVAIEFL